MTGETGAAATKMIDDYIAQLPDDQAQALSRLRGTVAAAAPDAVEAISYSMPAFKLGKRVLIYYAAFKDHLSLFPASGSVMDKLGHGAPVALHRQGHAPVHAGQSPPRRPGAPDRGHPARGDRAA